MDLGCGEGIDVILAARRIAPGGKVVVVDFAQPMIERATQAVAEAGLTDLVQFVVADLALSHLPDDFADAVVSIASSICTRTRKRYIARLFVF